MAVRKYELMVILDPVRSDEDQQQTIEKLNETVTKYGGTPDTVEVMGKRRLAYPINKRREGYYVLVYFDTETESEVLLEVERFCRFTEEVMRHLCIQAVIGKSKGDPSLFVDERPSFGRRPGGPPPRGPRGPEGDAPPASPPAPTAPAEAAPSEGAASPAPADAPATPAEPEPGTPPSQS